MTIPIGYYVDDDGNGRYRTLGAFRRDLDRLIELAGPYVIPGEDDHGPAAARIPDEAQRAEAEQLHARTWPIIAPHLDAINAAVDGQ